MTDHEQDAAEIGRAIYKSKILPSLQPEDKDKAVVIDVRSGDYEIDSDVSAAMTRLFERRPDAIPWWSAREGYPLTYRINPGVPQSEESRNAEKVGRAIYKSKILPSLQPEGKDKGKIVYIDVYSGDYEIDRDESAAFARLFERRPDGYTWAERVGYPALVHSFGWAGTYLPVTENEGAE